MDSVRIDKYLWAIRVFKTRSDATDACNGNKVKLGGVNAKPSKAVKAGDVLEIRFGARLGRYRVTDVREVVRKEDAAAMYEVLSELKEIAARPHGITCRCGSERYRMEVRHTYVDLVCSDCGARLRIPAATDEDLDRLCCHVKLQIKGK